MGNDLSFNLIRTNVLILQNIYPPKEHAFAPHRCALHFSKRGRIFHMLREYSCKIIATFDLMSKCIKHYYLPKVQLHGKI